MTKELIDRAITRFAEEVKTAYGSKLFQVILYGSCARGDYNDESDIDIMVLLDVPTESIKDERSKARAVANRLDREFNYDVMLMPSIQSKEHFEKYSDALPLFANIRKEGISYV